MNSDSLKPYLYQILDLWNWKLTSYVLHQPSSCLFAWKHILNILQHIMYNSGAVLGLGEEVNANYIGIKVSHNN